MRSEIRGSDPMKKTQRILFLFAWLPLTALASATPEEIARLGRDLTPTGAEKAGNAEGTIPEWTGGIQQIPVGFKKEDYAFKDPFADDKVLFSINATNVEQYKSKLSAGQVEMLKRFPKFRIDVYPTRRSSSLPDRINEGT